MQQSWFANWCRGQGKTKVRGRLPQIGRWQFSQAENLRGLSWAGARWVDLYTCFQILKVYVEALPGINHIFSSRWPQQHIVLLRLCPQNNFHCGNGRQGVYSRTGEERRRLQLLGSSLRVIWQSCHLDDLLSTLCDWFLQSYIPSSSTVCPEWCARGFTSMEVACLVLSGCTGGRQHSNNTDTCERKLRLSWFPK